jgi:hypothetical protein
MAGSYRHTINDDGTFRGVDLLDHLGDAFEALEEMYGMIWYLADGSAARVEEARQNYQLGIERSPGVNVRDE